MSVNIIFCIFVALIFLITFGDALMCHKCYSTDVNSRCRHGKRKHLATIKESCYGKSPQCYSYVTVTDNGDPYFERGCALENICDVDYSDKSILEYCRVCTDRYCNNEFMKINEEIEEYLQEQLSSSTEKTTTPVMTTHSHEWYRKTLRNRSTLVKMQKITTPSTTEVYVSPSSTEQFIKPLNEFYETTEPVMLTNTETTN